MQNYKTSSYFFPVSPHRMKNAFVCNNLRSAHRKDIKAHLVKLITTSYQDNSFVRSSNNSKKKIKTEPSKLHQSAHRFYESPKKKKDERESSIDMKSQPGLYLLLQKVRMLKQQRKVLEKDPFYRIQRHHFQRPSKTITRTLTKMGSFEGKQKEEEDSSDDVQQLELIMSAGQNEVKTRMKSETFTYYQIKTYFEKKYGFEENTGNKISSTEITFQ